ncbi:helix-turn-helix transcriptional regulator [Ensifer sp. ENS04]|nr:helix-turn-helix transcriptional regulator [Ensifer sp. ENS04]
MPYKPLAHPHRLLIVRTLLDGRARSAYTLARLLGLSRSSLFKHLSLLSECGFVTLDTSAVTRRFTISPSHAAALIAIVAAGLRLRR